MRHRCCVRQGFSLVETLVSSTLVLLVFGLASRFLVPLLEMQVAGSERAELQQRCAILADDLAKDLACSQAAGLELLQADDELILAIHRFDNIAQDGTLVWRDNLVIHRWQRASGLWTRAIWSDPTRRTLRASAPARPSQTELRQFCGESLPLRISQGVSSARIESEHAGANLGLPLILRMTVVSPAGESRQVQRLLGGRLPTP